MDVLVEERGDRSYTIWECDAPASINQSLQHIILLLLIIIIISTSQHKITCLLLNA